MKGKKTGGRTKGTPNKMTAALKDVILQALSNVGGVTYLEEQAHKNPTAFLTLVGRVIPVQVKEDAAEPQMKMPSVVMHALVSASQDEALPAAPARPETSH